MARKPWKCRLRLHDWDDRENPETHERYGVYRACDLRLLRWLMRIRCRPVTSTHTGAGEPVEVYGAGVSGVTGLLLRARGSVSWQRSLRTGAGRRWSPHGGDGGTSMEVMFDRVAGLDVGKESVAVCLRTPGPKGRRRAETRTFKTTTGSLHLMRDWLVEAGVSIAAMESTSVYWKPPFYCLEEVMEVWLLNAAHMKAVPGP